MTDLLRPRRRALLGLAGAALLPLPALGQGAWPERNVTLIVPFASGGASDMIARLVAEGLGPRIGRTVVVENPPPGAAANIGVGALARSAPDGHRIGIVSLTTMGMTPWLYADRLPFDPARNFAFISSGAITPNVLVVDPRKIPAATLPELAAWLRANPGRANLGSSGTGTAIHVAMEVFLAAAGLTATHVPYRGSGPMMTDLIGGQIDMAVDGAAVAWPHVQAGTIRALATTGARCGFFAPELPTLAETWPDAIVDPWHAACRGRAPFARDPGGAARSGDGAADAHAGDGPRADGPRHLRRICGDRTPAVWARDPACQHPPGVILATAAGPRHGCSAPSEPSNAPRRRSVNTATGNSGNPRSRGVTATPRP